MQSQIHVVSNEEPQTSRGAEQLSEKDDYIQPRPQYFLSQPDIHIPMSYLSFNEHNDLSELFKYDPRTLEKSLEHHDFVIGKEKKNLVVHHVSMDSANEKLSTLFGLLDSKRIQPQTNECVETEFGVHKKKKALTIDTEKILEDNTKLSNENLSVSNIHVGQMEINKETLENAQKQITENSIHLDTSEVIVLDRNTGNEKKITNKTFEGIQEIEEHISGGPNNHSVEKLNVIPDTLEDFIFNSDSSDTDIDMERIIQTLYDETPRKNQKRVRLTSEPKTSKRQSKPPIKFKDYVKE